MYKSYLETLCYVYFMHNSFCLQEDVDDALIVFYILETQGHALAVFEPLLSGLIAADVEIPCQFRHAIEVLFAVDIDTILLPAIAVNL